MLHKIRGWFASQTVVRYDDSFFSDQWFRSWDTLKDVLHVLIASEPRWRSILDYGCGPGVMIDLMNERGYRYVGCDVSGEARALYLGRYGRYPDRYVRSLDAVAGCKYDLLLSFDVLEHMRDEEIEQLLRTVIDIPEILVNISRARSIPGHVNIKSDRAWLRFFESCGWLPETARTEALRRRYLVLRPGGDDMWHKNLFLLRRRDAA